MLGYVVNWLRDYRSRYLSLEPLSGFALKVISKQLSGNHILVIRAGESMTGGW